MNQLSQLEPRARQIANSNRVKLTTNLYEVRLDKLNLNLYKYQFVITDIPLQIIKKQIHKLNTDKLKSIGFICMHEDDLIGTVKLNGIVVIDANVCDQETNMTYSIQVELSTVISLQNIFEEKLNNNKIINKLIYKFFQNHLGQSIQQKSTIQNIGKHKLEILPQFRFTLQQINKKLILATNAVLKIRENLPLLSYFDKYDSESIKQLFVGLRVVKNYGRRDVYRIEGIDFSKKPTDKMDQAESGLTFEQHYFKKYAVKIVNLNQPLLIVNLKLKSLHPKTVNSCFLLPELVSLYRRVNPSQFDERLQRVINKKSKLSPQDKENHISKVLKELSNNEFIKKSALSCDGYQLSDPLIQVDSRQYKSEAGIFDFRAKLTKTVQLKNWGIVYSEGKDAESDRNETSRLIANLKSVAGQYGVKIGNDPGLIAVKTAQWAKDIEDDIKNYGVPQILLLFLSEREEKLYAELKKLITVKFKCPSQVIRRKLVQEQTKRPLAITSDILLQIQVKIGAVPWQVVRGNGSFSNKRMMWGALLVAREGQQYSLSFVGTTNSEGTSVYCYFKKGLKQLKAVHEQYESVLMAWAKNYVISIRAAPQLIVIYHEGFDRHTQTVEFPVKTAIKVVSRKIGEKTKDPNYKPEFVYVSVLQNTNTEFYTKGDNSMGQQILYSPAAGTVIIDDIFGASNETFHLNAQQSYQDSSPSVSYTVLQKPSEISLENLIDFTYSRCYSNYNYRGASRLPSCLLYSHRLRRLCCLADIELELDGRINKTFFFL